MTHLTKITEVTSGVSAEGPIYAEITGRVTSIRQMKPLEFNVKTIKSKQLYVCICEYFCPLKEGDLIHGICTIEQGYKESKIENQRLKMIRAPFVTIPIDRESIIKSMLIVLKKSRYGTGRANKFYDHILDQTKSAEGVINYISELSLLWLKYKDEKLLIPFAERGFIKKDQLIVFLTWWFKDRTLRQLYLLGLTDKEIRKCNLPLAQIYQRCLKNPFTLTPISMEKCQDILNRIGKDVKVEDLTCGLIVRQIDDYMKKKSWMGIPSKILQSLYPILPDIMNYLKKEYGVKADYHTIYLEKPYQIETEVANLIEKLLVPRLDRITLADDKIGFINSNLTQDQKRAITGALNYPLSIISGAAGTGKTTIIAEIIHNLEQNEIPYMIVSFTGKAVARIREVIKRKSPSTMHRLISKALLAPKFSHLIIDEASMVTTELFYDFVKTFSGSPRASGTKNSYKITLIGDPNQLEPIGPGALFDQLLSSKRIPTFVLTQIHRTTNSVQNGILLNSQKIIEYTQSDPEHLPPFEFEYTNNFRHLDGALDRVTELVSLLAKNNVSALDITIVTPYNKDLPALNRICQQIFNGKNQSILDSSGIIWMLNDRVSLKENRYDINVMNGEEGIITEIGKDEIVVSFKDGAKHSFKLQSFVSQKPTSANLIDKINPYLDGVDNELTVSCLCHSFAISSHRSQGSEWKYLICYLQPNPANASFLTRRSIYTIITRAKLALWIIGDIASFTAAATRSPAFRCDNLAQRITHENEQISLKEEIML